MKLGSYDLGYIDDSVAAKIGVTGGPIRLQVGYPGPRGFGNLHVEAHTPRIKQLKELGYGSFLLFCAEVAQNYEAIQQGENDRLILIREKLGRDLRLIVEYCNQGDAFWTIITGMPYRVSRKKELFRFKEIRREGECEPAPSAAGKRSLLRLAPSKLLVPDDSAS